MADHQGDNRSVVILTGATGSLGSHLLASFARSPVVGTVVCLNRRSSTPGTVRQREALSSRKLDLTNAESGKLRMLDVNTAEPRLGLSTDEYSWLVGNATHIVHNAWPMSLARPIHTFAPQFQALRNLLDLAREMACTPNPNGRRIGFHTLPLDYPEAKWVCERMLDETLHRYPDSFRPMVMRLGQITGSTLMGIWPSTKHMPMLIKSAQSLQAWPDLEDPLHWIPVDIVAQAMVDLALPELKQSHAGGDCEPDAFPVYHIDNPVGQPWKEMASFIPSALGIPAGRVIPYRHWLGLLHSSSLDRDRDIPAANLMEFFIRDFEHMACGGLILDTARCQQHSKAMALQGPVSAEVKQYIEHWRRTGLQRQ
ncbi:hypothetical protein BDW62DRAFT_206262 [Aspergillus aurantiobrunneus]